MCCPTSASPVLRGGTFSGFRLIVLAVLGATACQLFVDTNKSQCDNDADCAAHGASFAGMICAPEHVCRAVTANVDAGPTTDPDPVLELKAGHYHSCVRRESGRVWCWGKNESGQTGDGHDPQTEPVVPTPNPVLGIERAAEISSGEDHSCARLTDGSVVCWGSNVEGQLGSGTFDSSPKPVVVKLPSKAVSVANGASFTCAALDTGTVFCWGSNSQGQMGNGRDAAAQRRTSSPVAVTGIHDALAVSAGQEHACALLRGSSAVCWGANDTGQLGMGQTDAASPTSFESVPVPVAKLKDVRVLSLGEKHSCATLVNKDTYCWGENSHAQLGLPLTVEGSAVPTLVEAISGATTQLSAGGDHVCAQLKDGSLVCWGSNAHAQLGRDSAIVSESVDPVELNGVGASRLVSAGDEHTCALLLTGKLVCFGQNKQGQLGDGLKEENSFVPVEVVGIP